MTPSGKHENKAYILHVALDVAEGKIKKLRGNTSSAVTQVDGKFLEDKCFSYKIDHMRNTSKKCYEKIGGIQKYHFNTFLPLKNK